MVDFGARLRLLRQSKGLTQKQLAENLNLTKSVVSAYETDMRLPSYDVLIKISNIFGVSTDYLLGVHQKKTLEVSDLNDADYQMILTLIDRLRKNKP